ncbi:MAG: Nif3-like dinuclear metal center hexameric protein [Chloroflexi bacterium]|nr:Nif3-like dinuclear metal center hexameric protein [Chloroflexota bacterium]
MQRKALVQYLNSTLKIEEIEDISNNGLQVEGADEVQCVAFAVDGCQAAIEAAIAADAHMLIVHHGLFWSRPLLLVGPHRRRVKALLDAGCSLYAAHLPLDVHPEVGNNVQLARLLGLTVTGDFGDVGVEAQAPEGLTLSVFVAQVQRALGYAPRLQAHGPEVVQRIAIMSGRATREIAEAALAGCDTFLTGEPLHDVYHDPVEYGINVIFAGHYATEKVGLQALARHLEAEFGLNTVFVDLPTGL